MTNRVLTGDRCQCRSCFLYFNSTAAFDAHRNGAFGVNRRCLASQEMEDRGMAVNSQGYWVTKLNPKFAAQPTTASNDATEAP